MRLIVQKELELSAAGVPVIVYVSPPGARAASAGVWISEAADVLAMAPETNIGSSTPISSTGANIGSDLRRKVINDAAASLRGLAASHERNAAWANSAVRVASNLTDVEALHMHVVDVLAPTLPALLAEISGRTTVPDHLTLHTAGAVVTEVQPGFLVGLLSALLDPNVVSLLFLAGILGIGFELFHPGVVLPGALGVVALVLSLFGLSVLSVSTTGLPARLRRCGAPGARRLRREPWRLDARGPSRPRLRARRSLPLCERPVPRLGAADRCVHRPAGRRLGVRDGEGRRCQAPSRRRGTRRDRGDGGGRPPAAGSCSCGGNSGARRPRRPSRRPGQRVRVDALEGLVLRVRPL